jgi:hypothetical protein
MARIPHSFLTIHTCTTAAHSFFRQQPYTGTQQLPFYIHSFIIHSMIHSLVHSFFDQSCKTLFFESRLFETTFNYLSSTNTGLITFRQKSFAGGGQEAGTHLQKALFTILHDIHLKRYSLRHDLLGTYSFLSLLPSPSYSSSMYIFSYGGVLDTRFDTLFGIGAHSTTKQFFFTIESRLSKGNFRTFH